MSDFDPDDAAARHRPSEVDEGVEECLWCGLPWPCDAAQALDIIRELQAETDRAWKAAAAWKQSRLDLEASVRPDRGEQ